MQHRHFTSPAKPGPPRDRAAGAGTAAAAEGRVGGCCWSVLPHRPAAVRAEHEDARRPSTTATAVPRPGARRTRSSTASIDPNGGVTGKLKNGDNYTSQVPLALNDSQLAPILKAHGVAITGVGPTSSLVGGPAVLPAARCSSSGSSCGWGAAPAAARGRDHGHSGARRRRSTTSRSLPPASATSPATRARSGR